LKKFRVYTVRAGSFWSPLHKHKDQEIFIGPVFIKILRRKKLVEIKVLKNEAVIIKANIPHEEKRIDGSMFCITERDLEMFYDIVKLDVKNKKVLTKVIG